MNKECLQKLLAEKVLLFDGGFGTELYRRNFFVNTSYEALNIFDPKTVTAVHQAYLDAGSDVLTTNTFNANPLALAAFGLETRCEEINSAAVAIARKASAGNNDILIAGSVGPVSGAPAEKIISALKCQINALCGAGADFIIFESISNLADLKNVIAAWDMENPAWVPSFVFDGECMLADGSTLDDVVKLLSEARYSPAAMGFNCGTGPDVTLSAQEKAAGKVDLPLIIQPGAGVPRNIDHRFMPMTTPEYFTTFAIRYVNLGARGVGGCCGIFPGHIADLSRSLKPLARGEKGEVFQQISVVESQLLDETPAAEKSTFGAKLAAGKWVKLLEMIPPKGFDLTDTIAKAKLCKEAGFDAVNLPDGPRASCRISQVVTAAKIQECAGIETIVHCCCRDRNLISLQSMILGCMAENIKNILFITGDPPKLGNYPFSSGVFDVDSIGMVKFQKMLNRGIDVGGQPLGNGVKTSILTGVGVDPNAIDPEREFRRLAEKIDAGAEFIITQPVFEPDVLRRFLDRIRKFDVPVIAGVWPFASYRNALFMKNEVPGVVVPDWIMEKMEAAGDKEAQRQQGIAIARSIIEAVKGEVRGIATSAPLGRVDTAIEVCKGY